MSITIEELINLPHLGLRLWAGTEASIERTVDWAHVCELADPTPWFEGGEILMTSGLAVPASSSAQVEYVTRLAEHQLAGLVISDNLHAPTLTTELGQAADALAFPVLSVSLEVPFITIARLVASSVDDSLRNSLLAEVQVLETMRLAAQENLALTELVELLEVRTGYRLYALGRDGKRLHPNLPEPPEAIVARLWPRPETVPARVPEGFMVSIPLFDHGPAYLLALEDERLSDQASLAAIQHAATLVALQLERIYREQEVLRREGAETLSELLSSALSREGARRRLELAGFQVDMPLVFLAFHDERGTEALAEAGTALHTQMSEVGVPNLMLVQQELLALVPEDAPVEQLLEPLWRVRVGMSSPFEFPGAFAIAKHEALWALRQARHLGARIVTFSQEPAAAGLLPNDPGLLRELVSRVIGPLAAYDLERGTDLVDSARVWLEHDREIRTAAHILHVHPQTLRYRLRRIEEITGRRLARSRDVAELWLAFQAQELGP